MSRFKERLWRELVREHGADLARISRPTRRGRLARPRLLAGTTVGLAGIGTAVALLVGAAGTSPAFAVTQRNDGTVSVVIRRLGAINLVNERLVHLGLRARFVQVAASCAVPAHRIRADWVARRQVLIGSVTVKRGLVNARFDPRKIPTGRTLVVGAWRQGREVKVSPGRIIRGGAPGCLPIAAVAVRIHRGAGAAVQCTVVAPSPFPGAGNSGNGGAPPAGDSGPSPAGSSGNSGAPPAGNSGPPPTGSSGNSGAPAAGNSGPSPAGSSGNSGAPPAGNSGPPPTGASGNSGPTPIAPARALHGPLGCPPLPKALALARRAEARKRLPPQPGNTSSHTRRPRASK